MHRFKRAVATAKSPSCCCYCCVASVVSDSVRLHRRQPTRLPPSLGFSRQEHWSGSLKNFTRTAVALETEVKELPTWVVYARKHFLITHKVQKPYTLKEPKCNIRGEHMYKQFSCHDKYHAIMSFHFFVCLINSVSTNAQAPKTHQEMLQALAKCSKWGNKLPSFVEGAC